jgi:hypothetical protein
VEIMLSGGSPPPQIAPQVISPAPWVTLSLLTRHLWAAPPFKLLSTG